MTSFQISVTPSRRAAARHITRVRRALQKAFAEESGNTGLTYSEIAREIGVHRSVINRELRGQKDLTLGRVGELAWALGRKAIFELIENTAPTRSNTGIDRTDRSEGAGTEEKGILRPKVIEEKPQGWTDPPILTHDEEKGCTEGPIVAELEVA